MVSLCYVFFGSSPRHLSNNNGSSLHIVFMRKDTVYRKQLNAITVLLHFAIISPVLNLWSWLKWNTVIKGSFVPAFGPHSLTPFDHLWRWSRGKFVCTMYSSLLPMRKIRSYGTARCGWIWIVYRILRCTRATGILVRQIWFVSLNNKETRDTHRVSDYD